MKSKKNRPLSTVKSGQTACLAGIDAGRNLKTRLAAMGLIPNAHITVVTNERTGPFIIAIKGSKMMLGRGIAHKILVT